MTGILTEKNVADAYVPIAWQVVLDDLSTFVNAEAQVCSLTGKQHADCLAELERLHTRLLTNSADLLEPEVLAGESRLAEVELFARATLMLVRMRECVAADMTDCIDTVELDSLRLYEPDIPACHRRLLRIRRGLERFPELSVPTLPRIEAEVERDIQDAKRKRRVVNALRAEFRLDDTTHLRTNLFRFFEACYPGTGLVETEVDLILTGTMIFFCLPFHGSELRTARYEEASEAEKTPVRDFLKRVGKFAHWQFAHFPVFGFLKGEKLPRPLLESLAARSGMTCDEVAWEISRLIAIVPTQDADKYVVHDVWGHGWQASMLHFEHQYERLATFADPVTSDDEVLDLSGSKHKWLDAFPIVEGSANFEPQPFDQFVTKTIHSRLATAMTPVIAELLADVIEAKLVNPTDGRRAIPNSSVLQDYPSKLDLMLQDVKFYFRQPSKSFRLWATLPKRQQTTITELQVRGASAASAERAVKAATLRWQELEQTLYQPQLEYKPVGGRLHVNLYTLLALNFLGVHRAMVQACEEADQMRLAGLPLQSFRDLKLMAAAVFFEANPTKNLWRVDEFLSLRIRPLCKRLVEELRET